MSIQQGDTLPDVKMHVMEGGSPVAVSTADLFSGKRVVMFAVPGAFTPTCSEAHLPGFVVKSDEIKACGIDDIVCLSVNDAFVMEAWARDRNAEALIMVGDGNGDLTNAIGLEMDGSGFGLGSRSQRYAMVVRDGVVEKMFLEEPGKFKESKAESVLEYLSQ